MANKALATRQKMRIRIEPSQTFGKPRNPFAAAAKSRVAGSHAKPLSSERQAAKRALKKMPLEPEETGRQRAPALGARYLRPFGCRGADAVAAAETVIRRGTIPAA